VGTQNKFGPQEQIMPTLEEVYKILDLIEPDEYGCHIYPSKKSLWYYRIVSINGVKHRVSHLVLERKFGRPIRPGYFALHHCDTPGCVNPEHLYEGAPADNMQDRMERNPKSWDHVRTPKHRIKMKIKMKRKREMQRKARWWKNPKYYGKNRKTKDV
jgi:hypothetical protein